MTPRISDFGTMPDGTTVQSIALSNGGMLSANVLTYGVRIQDLRLKGFDYPHVLGSPKLEPYLGPMKYFGALVGRFANRIANGQFTLDGQTYHLPRTWAGKHALHGGPCGTWQRAWSIDIVSDTSVSFTLTLADGDMGFPGELAIRATVSLDDHNALGFDVTATTTAATPCSFSHHGFFNLDGTADITSHTLQANALESLAVDDELIPTGETLPVDNSILDFRQASVLGKRGLDHNLCFPVDEQKLHTVACLHSPKSGLTMRVETNQPGLQVYDGGYFPETGIANGLEDRIYGPFAGMALEPQAWPDAPNHDHFPSAILWPGETYRFQTRYVFEQT